VGRVRGLFDWSFLHRFWNRFWLLDKVLVSVRVSVSFRFGVWILCLDPVFGFGLMNWFSVLELELKLKLNWFRFRFRFRLWNRFSVLVLNWN
jgi:hypothetical protein